MKRKLSFQNDISSSNCDDCPICLDKIDITNSTIVLLIIDFVLHV